jgi:transcriptional regulator with XRE-family HTH domain
MSDKLLDRQLGLRLRALRAHQGLSLGALADRSGVSKAMIARV